jgi:signal transduction histidine kinase
VSAIILIALEVPLAILVYRAALDAEVVEMQARAATALAEIELPLDGRQLAQVAQEPDVPSGFAVYDLTGDRLVGRGPATADDDVHRALLGTPTSSRDGAIIVTTPILHSGTERVQGALRVEEPLTGASHRARVLWVGMGIAGLVALALAWLLATRLARALAEPLTNLAESAERIGETGVLAPQHPTGIPEIDSLAEVLDDRARAVNDALRRERQLTADVSHQLRTPVAALRLKLDQPPWTVIPSGALADLDRLEETIEHLIAVARDAIPQAEPMDLDRVAAAAVARWVPIAADAGRIITGPSPTRIRVRAHAASVAEVLNVLVDNALTHGRGDIRVSIRPVPGGVAVDVADEGSEVTLLDGGRIFERGVSSSGTGIGLAVARAIALAEGGRLELSGQDPTVFSLLLLDATG